MHVLLSVACSLLLSADPRTDGLAKEVGAKGWIVYSARTEKGDWDIFRIRPDGSQKRNLTNTAGTNELGPRVSPDGKRILFRAVPLDVKLHHDRWGRMGQLGMMNADGSSPSTLGETGELAWATWSPDGKQMATLTPAGVEIRDVTSRKVIRTLDRKGIYQQLVWSPDGKYLAGPANHYGENWTVVRMSVDTGEVNPIAKFQNCTPDWFPDSRRIIHSSRPANQEELDGALAAGVGQRPNYGWTQLWMADGDGKNRSLVYGQDGKHVYGGAISPDGKYVLFTLSPTDGGIETAVMHLMRLSDAPAVGGESKALRKAHPDAKDAVILPLGPGWEPHWSPR